MNEHVRAVGYTRLSQDSDRSINAQERDIREYVDDNGWELVNVYDDGQHSSGFDDGREAYQSMLEAAHTGEIDAILVTRLDRLSRDKTERVVTLSELEDAGVDVVAVNDGGRVDLSDDQQWLSEVVSAYADDVAKRKERAAGRRAVQDRVDAGYWQGTPLLGTQIDSTGRYLVADPDGMQTVMDYLIARARGLTQAEAAADVGISQSSGSRLEFREETYVALAAGRGLGQGRTPVDDVTAPDCPADADEMQTLYDSI